MERKNGFFQLVIKQDGTYLKLIPPVGNGKSVDFDDINSYLYDIGIHDFDVKAVGQVLEIAKGAEAQVRVSIIPIKPENEILKLKFSEDEMYAVGRFYPPSTDGKQLSANDIERILSSANIVHGIMRENIENFLKNRCYCEDIILAQGTKPIEGRNAAITYHFNTDNSLKPKVNEDGTVDFHKLELISNINKGDILATLEPAILGTEGTNIYGKAIYPKKVVRKTLKHGKDIYLSEDGLTMYSNVSGHAMLTEDRVFVSNTYDVLADVDTSTGDISYEGNVTVKGNVITGFSIYAKGDIVVNGVVEGATLVAGGHVILKRGMQGMSRGKIEAGGNVVSKFIENAEVKASGYISAEAILHSKVSAKGEITVGGKKGLITGGEIRSGISISVKTVGSAMGTPTTLEVGVDPRVMEEFRELEKTIKQKQNDLDKLLPIVESYKKKIVAKEVLPPSKVEYIKLATQSCIALRAELKEAAMRYESLYLELGGNERAAVKVENIAYPGVKIIISNVTHYVRKETHYSRFIRDKADVKIVGL